MTSFLRGVVLIVAPLVSVAPTGATGRLFQPATVITGPSVWVSFSADTHRIAETDGATYIGRAYQHRDGSVRHEDGRSGQPLNSIFIKSHEQSMSYHWTPDGGWRGWGLTLPPEALHQPQSWMLNERIRLRPEPLQGYQVIVTSSRSGWESYRAPALNFYELAKRVPCRFDAKAICGMWLSNITVAEQPPELFVPPPDALIR